MVGGGGSDNNSNSHLPGEGGGENGTGNGYSTGGSLNQAGSASYGTGGFGYGGSRIDGHSNGGGGGGWYGGSSTTNNGWSPGGAGGSGYVWCSKYAPYYPSGKSSLLTTLNYLTDYSMSNGVRTGNGQAKITLQSD